MSSRSAGFRDGTGGAALLGVALLTGAVACEEPPGPPPRRAESSKQGPHYQDLTSLEAAIRFNRRVDLQHSRRVPGRAGGPIEDRPCTQLLTGTARYADPTGAEGRLLPAIDPASVLGFAGEEVLLLRRGCLFGWSAREGQTRPTVAVAPGNRHRHFDGVLADGREALVLAYERGTQSLEIHRFERMDGGRIRRLDPIRVQTRDSMREEGSLGLEQEGVPQRYLARFEGGQLSLQLALELRFDGADVWLPRIAVGAGLRFEPLLSPRDIQPLSSRMAGATLHVTLRCNLRSQRASCSATGILGPPAQEMVSGPEGFFVTVADGATTARRSALLRSPYVEPSAGPPAVHVVDGEIGGPPRLAGEYLVAILMAGPNEAHRRLEFPLADFRNGLPVENAALHPLAPLGPALVHAVVGPYFVAGAEWSRELLVSRVGREGTARVPITHPFSRLLPLGSTRVLLIGHTQMTVVSLSPSPRVTGAIPIEEGAHQGALRAGAGPGGGTIVGVPHFGGGDDHPMASRVEIIEVNREGEPRRAGALRSGRLRADGCVEFCPAWSGNTQLFFLGERLFALMGYEIVEARLDDRRLSERRRVNLLAPAD